MKLLSKHKLFSCSKIESYKILTSFIAIIQFALILFFGANCINFEINYFPKHSLIRFCDAAPNMSITNYEDVFNRYNEVNQVSYQPISFIQRIPEAWLKPLYFR